MEPPRLTEGLTNSKQESIIGTQNGSDLFNEMKHQFLSFKRQKFLENLECYENLAKSQAPKFMVIACADSRVCLSYILGFQPREAFVVRNVANLVPLFENVPTETNAALEFAVNSLEYVGAPYSCDISYEPFLGLEIGMGQMDHCENDFEADMLKDTADYYSRKASNWILEDSCPDYMLKVEECLKREKDRVAHYLHSSSELKLLEKVQHELLSVYATQLLEQEHSRCHALLRDDKVEDLSRMYRLFSKIPRGLNPVSSIFKQHVTAEGTALVKQAEDAASNKKDDEFLTDLISMPNHHLGQWALCYGSFPTLRPVQRCMGYSLTKADKKDVVGLHEQVFVRKVIKLHDKYMAYVNNCFMNHTLFHKALKEAFEVFCNKVVGGSSSAELLATFCDKILNKEPNNKTISPPNPH
ncbi:hypothetical protein TEA_027812 [Camellia sinensis var. sinensis]|uniref:Cullin-5 n=2 Tax=Camellia sinensis TaxID=4442 RepID=A0A4S4E3Q5_CAMSN|nr:hypothetical protein TEA_027812 [Camellia sinensis var. sinensis]